MPRPRPDSAARAHRPNAERPRILLLCAEAVGPQALCVEDSLRTRGFRVRVELGRRARRWVRSVPPGPPTLRVLVVPTIDPAYAQRLCQGRPDFHIVGLTTPKAVVEQIETLAGKYRSDRVPRPSRMILAQPTLMEQSLHVERQWGRLASRAAAAVALVLVGGMFGTWLARSQDDPRAEPAAPAMVRAVNDDTVAPTATMRDEPVLSAVAPAKRERRTRR